MSGLAISLLGSFSVTLDDKPLTTFSTDKVRALLAFLAVEANRPHRREVLLDLLWPNRAPAAARNSLRQAIYHLRKILADSKRPAPYLLISAKEIRFDPTSDHWLDVVEHDACLCLARTRRIRGQSVCPDCLARLVAAAELYRGDFLAGFSLPDCPRFTWWRLVNQEACHRKAVEALSILTAIYEEQQEYDQVSRYVCRQIELEPLRESAYRLYMRILALNGQGGEALRQYEICCKLLEEEMRMEPSAETTWLYRQIRAGRLPGLN